MEVMFASGLLPNEEPRPVLLAACQAALAYLSQNKTYPADIEAARNTLRAGIEIYQAKREG